MPLLHGKSQKAFTHNIREEMHAGKPQKQSLAIAYAMKKKKPHEMAEGGMATDDELEESQHELQRAYDAHEKEKSEESYAKMKSAYDKHQSRTSSRQSKEQNALDEKLGTNNAPSNRYAGKTYMAEGGGIDLHAMGKHKMHEKMSKRERAIRMFEGGSIEEEEKAQYDPKEEPGRKHNERAMHEDEHDLNQHGEYEEGPEGPTVDAEDRELHDEHAVENQGEGIEEDMVGRIMKQRGQVFAKGGSVHPHHMQAHGHHYAEGGEAEDDDNKYKQRLAFEKSSPGQMQGQRETARRIRGKVESHHVEAARSLLDPKSQPTSSSGEKIYGPRHPAHEGYRAAPGKEKEFSGHLKSASEANEANFAHGGGVDGTHMCQGAACMHMSHGGMAKHHYSEGGRVENDDEQELVDHEPNQFDDEHLDDHLDDDGKANYTGSNSGDELDDAQENHDRSDIISRIMNSRKKKDRMPRPA